MGKTYIKVMNSKHVHLHTACTMHCTWWRAIRDHDCQ